MRSGWPPRQTSWEGDLTKGTIVWFLTAGLVLFGNFSDASQKPNFFRKKMLAAVEFPVIVEFYLDVHSLSLLGELFLQAVLFLLVAITVVAARHEKNLPVKILAEWLLALIVIGLLVRGTITTIDEWEELNPRRLPLQFLLPVWLTIGLLPFIFLLSVYAAYDGVFRRLTYHCAENHGDRWRKLAAVVAGLRFNLTDAASFASYWTRLAAEARSFGATLSVVRTYRRERRDEERKEGEAKERLERFAGEQGVDGEGRQLDRREFEETKRALQWTANCIVRLV